MKCTHLVTLLLGVSLAANGFFVSTLLCHHHPKMPPPPPSPLTRMEKALDVLDTKEQSAVKEILEQQRPRFDAQAATMHEKIDRIQAVLTAPKLDKKALAAAFDSGSDHDAMRQNMKSLLTAIATTLPDEDRIKFFTETGQQMPHRR